MTCTKSGPRARDGADGGGDDHYPECTPACGDQQLPLLYDLTARRGLEPAAAGVRRLAVSACLGQLLSRFHRPHQATVQRVLLHGIHSATSPDGALGRVEENIAERRGWAYTPPEDLAALEALEVVIAEDREAVLAMLGSALR